VGCRFSRRSWLHSWIRSANGGRTAEIGLEGVRIGNLDGDFVDFLGATPGVGDGEPIGTDVGFGERFIDIEPPVIGGRLAFPLARCLP
jgi:hypothetical protein